MDHNENRGTLSPNNDVGEPELCLSSAPCQTESGGTILLQLFEFKTHLLEAVEELHIRKDAETRFEDQISKLVLEKQELEWEKEALQHQLERAVNQHSESLTSVKKQFQAQIRNIEEEKGKYQVSAELKDKEINNLKEELRSLQLLKYNLEKKSNELEQKLALQSRSKDSHLNQLGEVEKRFGALSRHCAVVKQAHEKLEQNVDEAMRLNNKLTSANKKQEATIVFMTKELDEVNNKLIKVQVMSVRHDRSHSHTAQKQEMQKLLQKLNMETEMNKKLQVENVAVRAEKQEVMKSLHQTQELLLSQTQTISRVELELQTQREQCQALKQEHEVMRDKRKAAEDKVAQLMESYAASKTSWHKEKKTLLDSTKSEQQDLQSLKEAYHVLYQKHSELSFLAKAQAQHISELEVSPLNELTSSSHLTSQRKNSDRSEDTGAVTKLVGATGGQEVLKQQPQSGFKQSLNTSHLFTCSLITSSEIDPAALSDLTHTTSSVSDYDQIIGKGCSAASVPNPDHSLITETAGLKNTNDDDESIGMNEKKCGGKDDEGQQKSNREEEERSEKEDVNQERSAEEKRGTVMTQKSGTVDRREDGQGSAEDAGNTRNPESETRDRGVGQGTEGAKERGQKLAHTLETLILTQTTTEKSNTLQVTDFMDTEPSLAVCEPLDCSQSLCELDAVSSHVTKACGTRREEQSLSFGDSISHGPDPVFQEQNLCPGEVQTHLQSQIHHISEKTTRETPADKSAELSEPLSQAMVCSAQTNSAPVITQRAFIVTIQESETTTGQTIESDKPSDITINVKQSDDVCHKYVSEDSVSAKLTVEPQTCPQSQEVSEQESKRLKLLATNDDDDDDSSVKREHHSNVVTQENCDRDAVQEPVEECAVTDVSVDITMDVEDTEPEAESGSVQDDMKKDKTADMGETKESKSDTDMKLSVASTGPRSSFDLIPVLHQFAQGSEQNKSGSGGSLRHPPSRILMFPRSRQSKVPLVITRASDLLNASSVSGNVASSTRHQQGEWKALGETFRETRAADTENRAALTSFPVSASSSTVSGQTWLTTPGCSRAPGSTVAPLSDCDWETSCSQEREEQQSSFRAQIYKIEQFLIAERLRQPKRRKTE
uniref:myosin heavy chain, skeletal muscle, adult-like n=1 Tax=Solea senegalensis TaxID=28829 RepID=UPI001CD8FC22|nr:myosin heavy chain, skeletal muscle, adult-like [Solea senegalensis]